MEKVEAVASSLVSQRNEAGPAGSQTPLGVGTSHLNLETRSYHTLLYISC